MEDEKRELRDSELNKVSGGSHLSESEVLSMQPGRLLMIEDSWGVDEAEAVYVGEYREPTNGDYLECKVKITRILNAKGYLTVRSTRFVRENDEVFISRYLLDFRERA